MPVDACIAHNHCMSRQLGPTLVSATIGTLSLCNHGEFNQIGRSPLRSSKAARSHFCFGRKIPSSPEVSWFP
jgi:hypothetical protein